MKIVYYVAESKIWEELFKEWNTFRRDKKETMAKYQILSNNGYHYDYIISLGDISIYLVLYISCKSASKCISKLSAFDVA